MTLEQNILRDEMQRGKEAGSEPCGCRPGYCLCVTRERALEHAHRAAGSFPKNLREAAFWTGFALGRKELAEGGHQWPA